MELIKELFFCLSIFLNILGTYYIAKSLFFDALALPLCLKKLRKKKISLMEKASALLFGISADDFLKKFSPNRDLSKKDIKKIRDRMAPIKGFALISLSLLIQLCFFVNPVDVCRKIISCFWNKNLGFSRDFLFSRRTAIPSSITS